MNPKLLNAIQQVEHKYGSLSDPNADLSNVHYIVKKLGLFGNQSFHKNKVWYFNGNFLTFNPKLIKVYHLLMNHLKFNKIKKIVHIDREPIMKVKNIMKLHKHLKLMDKSSILSIVG